MAGSDEPKRALAFTFGLERLGFVGRGEGIAAEAVVLLVAAS